MAPIRIGILLALFVFFKAVHGYGAKGELMALTKKLEALAEALHKEEGNIKLSPETMAILRDYAQGLGINDLEEALKLALSGSQTKGEQGVVLPPVVPPPPPPPPAVIQVPVGAPGEDILTQREGLKKTGIVVTEITPEQEQQSDEEFLKAFRDSQNIDEIIDALKALKDNPLYLKKEALYDKRASLPEAMSSGVLQLPKIIITRLLGKKNQLIFSFFNRDYLKDYMYDPDLFTQNDFDNLRALIVGEGRKTAPIINQNRVSDILFLNAFRSATSIEEIVQNLKDLESNPQYLKPESFKAALKLPINDLLKKKNLLVLEVMQPGSVYLKDYLFDTSLFTQEDYEALKQLFR